MTSFPGDFLGAVFVELIVLVLWFSRVQAATEFDFGTLTLSSLKLLGDAHLYNSTVRLSRDLDVPTSGAGKVLYAKPVRFRQPDSSIPASFSTFFSFSVINLNPSSIGGGLAFVITPEDETVGDGGAYLGIMGSKGPASRVVAVEFDTLMDLEFGDVNGNHIGLDLGSMVSTPARDLDAADVNLKSGDLVNSWIDYSGSTQLLNISVSYSNLKPKAPFLSIPLNLGLYVNDFMFVGFSGSTQGSTEIHSIEWWSFSSSFESDPKLPNSPGPPPPPPTATLMNPTADSIPAPPPSIPPSDSSNATATTAVVRAGKCHSGLCKHRAGEVAGVVTAGTFCLAFAAMALLWLYSKKLKTPKSSPGALVASDFIKTPKEFTYKNLKSATKGFDPCRIIGHGAFGTVYKGILPENGESVAVKRCSHGGGQGKTEFLSELSIIATLRHRNLVRLQGWCHQRGEILLVYDLMPNGSLDKALFESRMILPWHHRVKILLGIASALAYLHQECESQVIHRDIKTSNIMLDQTFNAKVGDFGLARTVEHDKSPDATVAAGTMGYLAPEYLSTGRATEKTDVFSYGAVVLEVASGRRPIEKKGEGGGGETRGNLVEWVWNLHGEGRLVSAADRRLDGEFDDAEMRRVLLVGLACSHPDPMARPTMRSVVQMLVGETDLPFVPRAKPTMSFTTTHLIETLQDSVSDLNGIVVFSPSSSSSSERNSFIAAAGAMDIV